MKKIISYSAISLNGKIARTDGSVDWLEAIPNPDGLDYGYYDFYSSVDTTIMGRKTFQQLIDWGVDFPYTSTRNYVFTTQKYIEVHPDVQFVSENHIEFLKNFKNTKGKNIWLIGGASINTILLRAHLIDEIHVHIMPIIIPHGIELFTPEIKDRMFDLIRSKSYPNGVMELKYALK